MSRNRRWLEDGVAVFTSFVVLLVGVPLFAAAIVAGRLAFLAALVAAVIVGAILYAFRPRFREWFGVQVCPSIEHKGLRMDTYVAFHPGHAWARLGREAVVTGADDLVQATLGPVEAVELPVPGTEVRCGDPLFVLRRGQRSVEVRAPVSGTVTATNSRVSEEPSLVNHEPFGDGWTVALRASDLSLDEQRLVRGPEAREWFRDEVDRLIALLEPAAAPALADGGVLVEGLHRYVDEPAWRRVQESFFASS